MVGHGLDKPVNQVLRILLKSMACSAQLLSAFDQRDVMTGAGYGISNGQSAQSAADDQGRVHKSMGMCKGHAGCCEPGNSHRNQICRFLHGGVRLVRVNVGAMLADVDHFDPAGVQPG